MKFITFFIFSVLLMLGLSAENTCVTFRCGGISQPAEGDRICVFRQAADSTNLPSSNCGNETLACSAWKWNAPSEATTNATCGTELPPQVYPPVFNLVANTAVPGDFCNVTEDCFSSAKMTSECKENVCVPNTEDQSPCDTNKDCPLTHICKGGRNNKKCEALPKTGEVCTEADGCLSNAICAKKEEETELKCVQLHSIENGKNYTLANEQRPDPAAIFSSLLCVDGHAFPIGTEGQSQCRPANRNEKEGVKGLARDEVGQSCSILTHVATEASAWETESNFTSPDTSKCGFNKDEKSYCGVQFGDEKVLADLRVGMESVSKTMCHRDSGNPTEGSYCAETKSFNEGENGFKVHKSKSMVASAQASANVMNNDRCVAETIMADFWQGNFDSAHNAGLIGLIFMSVTILLA